MALDPGWYYNLQDIICPARKHYIILQCCSNFAIYNLCLTYFFCKWLNKHCPWNSFITWQNWCLKLCLLYRLVFINCVSKFNNELPICKRFKKAYIKKPRPSSIFNLFTYINSCKLELETCFSLCSIIGLNYSFCWLAGTCCSATPLVNKITQLWVDDVKI